MKITQRCNTQTPWVGAGPASASIYRPNRPRVSLRASALRNARHDTHSVESCAEWLSTAWDWQGQA